MLYTLFPPSDDYVFDYIDLEPFDADGKMNEFFLSVKKADFFQLLLNSD
jgi:hypothetical protein